MKRIIDVSQWQGVIDWAKVKPQIDGAVLRMGYGSDDQEQDDKQFSRNYSECVRLGIPCEVYLYSYAKNEQMAISEAEHVKRLAKGRKILRVWYDLEEQSTGGVAKRTLRAFTDALDIPVGLYTYESYYNAYLRGVSTWPIWCAKYATSSPSIGQELTAWQYTSGEKIDGISGRVDCSHWYGDFAKDQAAPKYNGDVFRLYKDNRHFYTVDEEERDARAANGWRLEGVGWKAPKNGSPVYRYRKGAEYIWTADKNERLALLNDGWTKECIAFRSGKAVPVYRLYKDGDRVYTANKNELKALLKAGWRDEGIACFGRR